MARLAEILLEKGVNSVQRNGATTPADLLTEPAMVRFQLPMC